MRKKSTISKKVADFFKQGKILFYKRGEGIVSRQQSSVSNLFYIKHGYVHQFGVISNKPISINIFKTSSYFPRIDVFSSLPNSFTYMALTDATLYVMPRTAFLKFLKENNDIFYELVTKLSVDFNILVAIIESLMQRDSRSKIIHILLIYARLLGVKKRKSVLINIPLTHLDIANMSGISRETATREMALLVKRKIIRKKGNRYWIQSILKLKKAV